MQDQGVHVDKCMRSCYHYISLEVFGMRKSVMCVLMILLLLTVTQTAMAADKIVPVSDSGATIRLPADAEYEASHKLWGIWEGTQLLSIKISGSKSSDSLGLMNMTYQGLGYSTNWVQIDGVTILQCHRYQSGSNQAVSVFKIGDYMYEITGITKSYSLFLECQRIMNTLDFGTVIVPTPSASSTSSPTPTSTPTPTPTPTPSPTPTATPTATPYIPDMVITVSLDVETAEVGETVTATYNIENVYGDLEAVAEWFVGDWYYEEVVLTETSGTLQCIPPETGELYLTITACDDVHRASASTPVIDVIVEDMVITASFETTRAYVGDKVTAQYDIENVYGDMYATVQWVFIDEYGNEDSAGGVIKSKSGTVSAYTRSTAGWIKLIIEAEDAYHTASTEITIPVYPAKKGEISWSEETNVILTVTAERNYTQVGEKLELAVDVASNVWGSGANGSGALYWNWYMRDMDGSVSDAYWVDGGDMDLTLPGHDTISYLPKRAGYLICEVTWHDTRDTTVTTDWLLVEPLVRFPGDADDNGKVNAYDAICILKYFIDSTTAINLNNADVNADGKADPADALLILQYTAGWNVTLR